jgi:putative flippase GtrA
MFSRYLVISALALAVDWLCLIALTSLAHIEAGAAAVASYLAGGVVNYALSRRFVFRSIVTGRTQIREAVLFAASCVLGAILTGAVVHVLAHAFGRLLAKSFAVLVSLGTLYWIRRLVVFNSRRSTLPERIPT